MAQQNRWSVRRKVRAAFEVLERRGDWLCLPFFGCCMRCASYDMAVLLEESSRRRKGAFFSRQAKDSMVPGGALWIGYGWYEGADWENKAAGEELKEALEAQGLRVDWDGDPARRIAVPVD